MSSRYDADSIRALAGENEDAPDYISRGLREFASILDKLEAQE